jgi:predicted nucleic acid-binding protein
MNAAILRRAFQILDSVYSPSPLSPADAIIAATALIHKLPLYTLDPGRFGIVPGLNCIPPYWFLLEISSCSARR